MRSAASGALEALLVEKGLISTDAIDAVVDLYENDVGPQNGARVVARAWVDEAYRERLRANGSAAIAELGYGGFEGDTMVIVENTPTVHNVIVCTLCSCYPWPVLGLPPTWYKSSAYRARVVAEPRAVLSRVRPRARDRGRGAGMGFDCRGALPRAADASGGHRRAERGASSPSSSHGTAWSAPGFRCPRCRQGASHDVVDGPRTRDGIRPGGAAAEER